MYLVMSLVTVLDYSGVGIGIGIWYLVFGICYLLFRYHVSTEYQVTSLWVHTSIRTLMPQGCSFIRSSQIA